MALLDLANQPVIPPILSIKKPNGEYWIVQDLRAVNEATGDIHPVVPNPYTLLVTLPPPGPGILY